MEVQIEGLPLDTLNIILSYLDYRSLVNVMCVNNYFLQSVSSSLVSGSRLSEVSNEASITRNQLSILLQNAKDVTCLYLYDIQLAYQERNAPILDYKILNSLAQILHNNRYSFYELYLDCSGISVSQLSKSLNNVSKHVHSLGIKNLCAPTRFDLIKFLCSFQELHKLELNNLSPDKITTCVSEKETKEDHEFFKFLSKLTSLTLIESGLELVSGVARYSKNYERSNGIKNRFIVELCPKLEELEIVFTKRKTFVSEIFILLNDHTRNIFKNKCKKLQRLKIECGFVIFETLERIMEKKGIWSGISRDEYFMLKQLEKNIEAESNNTVQITKLDYNFPCLEFLHSNIELSQNGTNPPLMEFHSFYFDALNDLTISSFKERDYNYLASLLPKLQNLTLEGSQSYVLKYNTSLTSNPLKLRKISLKKIHLEDQFFTYLLDKSVHLLDIHLEDTKVEATNGGYIIDNNSNFSSIRTAKFIHSELEQSIIYLICNLASKTLRRLILHGCKISTSSQEMQIQTGSMMELQEISVHRLGSINHGKNSMGILFNIFAIKSVPNLQILDISDTGLDVMDLNNLLFQCTKLRVFKADNVPCNNSTINQLIESKCSINELVISGNISERELRKLKMNQSLSCLRCMEINFSSPENAIEIISPYTGLRVLSMKFGHIPSKLFKILEKNIFMECLIISGKPSQEDPISPIIIQNFLLKLHYLTLMAIDFNPFPSSDDVEKLKKIIRASGRSAPKLIMPYIVKKESQSMLPSFQDIFQRVLGH